MTHWWKGAAVATAVAVLASIGSVLTAAKGIGVTDCDRLAQPPRAAMGGLPALVGGVSFAELRWSGARPACAKAMADAPGERQFVAFTARAADKGGDQKTAAQLYRAAADDGYPLAQTNLGVMFEQEQGGLAKSDREAERLYRLAADQGFPAAHASLATFYVQGRGELQRDDREAAQLFRLAADFGNVQAQNHLGKLYAERRGGLSRNLDEAARWWRLAADGGVEEARATCASLGGAEPCSAA